MSRRLGAVLLVMAMFICSNDGRAEGMKITSPEFDNNKPMPKRFGYRHDNVNPALNIEGVPSQAKSLVLIVDDPDAPGGVWLHWLVYDIPVITEIEEGTIPGKQGINDYRTLRYGGPNPPSGTHHYFFRVYALDKELGLKEGVDRKMVEKAMSGHVLTTAELVGLYGK